MRRWLAVVAVSACYRGETAPTNPTVLIQPQTCNPDDDSAHPVIDTREGRLRIHSRSPLTPVRGRAGGRGWIGPAVPDYVAKQLGSLELMLLDEVEGGYLAVYRDPYNAGSCRLSDDERNCDYTVRRYRDRNVAWSLKLGRLFSRPDHLEVQDIRLAGGVLYFNEACTTYSNEAGGDCSSLVAVDPQAGRVLWRTPSLVSNGRFAVTGCYVVAGYGFTDEPDAVHLIDRATGKVLHTVDVASAPQRYTVSGDDVEVELYSGTTRRYRLDRAAGKLVDLDPEDPDLYGGAAYGGAMYGGFGYGGPQPRPRRR